MTLIAFIFGAYVKDQVYRLFPITNKYTNFVTASMFFIYFYLSLELFSPGLKGHRLEIFCSSFCLSLVFFYLVFQKSNLSWTRGHQNSLSLAKSVHKILIRTEIVTPKLYGLSKINEIDVPLKVDFRGTQPVRPRDLCNPCD